VIDPARLLPSTRVRFVLSLSDGTEHTCLGRLVYLATTPRGRHSVADELPSRWVIHLLAGPELLDEDVAPGVPLDILLADGRAARVVIADDATLRGVSDLQPASP
jgi:hypothetical protein